MGSGEVALMLVKSPVAVQQVITDNGGEVAGAFQKLVACLGIPYVKVTPYNKHANRVVEQVMQYFGRL